MRKSVRYSNLKGTVQAPASKSFMQRAVGAALLSEGQSILRNPSFCADSLTALGIAESLGGVVTRTRKGVRIQGYPFLQKPLHDHLTVDCGESGLSTRMFASIAALFSEEVTFHGQGSLSRRPLDMIEQPLSALGARCITDGGFLPMTIRGPLTPGEVTVDGSVSSQFLSGLLMALPLLPEDSVVKVENLTSKPYIDMTLEVMKMFGVDCTNREYREFRVPGNQRYLPADITIEGDWSGAAFLMVGAALAGEVRITGISENSRQGDKQVIDAVKAAGALISIREGMAGADEGIDVKQGDLKGFTFDAAECPDLFPPLAALGVHCGGTTMISGVHRLTHKESNRGIVLQEEFSKLGADIVIEGDMMIIHGSQSSGIHGGAVDSHGDHRIAMALAIAGLKSGEPVIIEGAECVAKSYENFFSDLERLGAV